MRLITDLVIFATLLIAACSDNSPAKLLLKYDERSQKFILGDDALREIEALTGPVKIIGAIGDARVGKSTNLNFIRYFLDGNTNQRVQKVFKTSDSVEPCTTACGYRCCVTQTSPEGRPTEAQRRFSVPNVAFERTNLEGRRCRDVIPELMVILRNALSPSPGKTLQGQIQDFILSGKYGETIARHFLRHRTKVRDIPFVGDSKRFSDLEQFLRDDYAKVSSSLAADFQRFPAKKTVSGANMDPKMIADLARKLRDAINQNSWSGFSNTYIALETDLCDRSFQEIIEPLLRKDLDQIKSSMARDMDRFAEKCALETEKTKASEKITKVIAQKVEIIKKQRRLEEERIRQAEQERWEREREQERLREAREGEQRLDEERRACERAEEQRRIQDENVRRAEEEERMLRRRKDDDELVNVVKNIFTGVACVALVEEIKKLTKDNQKGIEALSDEFKKLIKDNHKVINALSDEFKKLTKIMLKEDARETKYSIRELSETLIKVVNFFVSVMNLVLQIRALFR
ncbi:hypothetical protein OS493_010921 [Desmophyllum pertusum]|uniref:Uncharacterized protein n=1 Tax=Desmophyllum pertusum TaxID=174260 RepID=A0A9W9ZEF1_9CNID|nr:hypothetical protein OS493_010921 [Desmophyllum pertusum]